MAIKHEIRTDEGLEIVEGLTARKAIRLFCSECNGYQPTLVKSCLETVCPLWPYRTYATPKDTVL